MALPRASFLDFSYPTIQNQLAQADDIDMMNRIIFIFVTGFSLVLISHPMSASAASFDFNVNSDAVRFTLTKSTARGQVGDFGVLMVDKSKKYDSENVIHLGYHWLGNNFRVGFRSIYASPGDYDILALGIGFQARTAIATNLFLGGHFYYAPSAFSFLDGDGYDEFALRLMLKMGRSAFVYLGYRKFEFGISPFKNNYELDDDFHIGLRFYF